MTDKAQAPSDALHAAELACGAGWARVWQAADLIVKGDLSAAWEKLTAAVTNCVSEWAAAIQAFLSAIV